MDDGWDGSRECGSGARPHLDQWLQEGGRGGGAGGGGGGGGGGGARREEEPAIGEAGHPGVEPADDLRADGGQGDGDLQPQPVPHLQAGALLVAGDQVARRQAAGDR